MREDYVYFNIAENGSIRAWSTRDCEHDTFREGYIGPLFELYDRRYALSLFDEVVRFRNRYLFINVTTDVPKDATLDSIDEGIYLTAKRMDDPGSFNSERAAMLKLMDR